MFDDQQRALADVYLAASNLAHALDVLAHKPLTRDERAQIEGEKYNLEQRLMTAVTTWEQQSGTPAPPPVVPQVEPPDLATFANGRLTLTPAGRRLFMQALIQAAWAGTADGRSAVLANLPSGVRAGVSWSSVAQLHLNSILSTAEAWPPLADGRYPLIMLAEDAAILSHTGPEAATLRGIAAALRARVA